MQLCSYASFSGTHALCAVAHLACSNVCINPTANYYTQQPMLHYKQYSMQEYMN